MGETPKPPGEVSPKPLDAQPVNGVRLKVHTHALPTLRESISNTLTSKPKTAQTRDPYRNPNPNIKPKTNTLTAL